MKKQSYLDKIDNYLSFKTQSETSLIFAGSFILIAFLSYLILFDPSEEYSNEAQDRYNQITAKLDATQAYINSISKNGDDNYEIKQQQNKLAKTKEDLEEAKKVNDYFDNKLHELSYLLFNEQNWADFLSSLTQKAKQYNVKIDKIENNTNQLAYQKPQEVVKIVMTLQGNFKDILEYINSIEESKLVIDINYIDIKTQGYKLAGEIHISVWGMKY